MAQMVQLLTAFTGSLGFALLFNIRREKAFLAALGGFLGWAVFLAVRGCFRPMIMSAALRLLLC
ncbi:MAG: threonine/serine exporter family protein [Blautia sp.]